VLFDPIHGDIGEKCKFSSSFLSSRAATVGPPSQSADGLVELAHRRLPVVGAMILEIIADVL